MDKTTKTIVGLIIALVVIGVVYSIVKSSGKKEADSNSTEPIKIGWIGPLSGDTGNLGENAKAATEIAVNEVNSEGGINGRKLEVTYEDGKCNGKDASNAANKLINVDKVAIILGGACSGETSSFTGAAEQSRTTVLSYCSSVPALSQAGDYIFRDYPSDTYQGSFAADYVYNKLGKRKVAVLYVKSDWGSGIKDVFIQQFKKLGGEIVAEEGYDQTSRDLRTQLTKVKDLKPDLLYFLGYTEASIPGLQQAAAMNLNVPIFGGDAWDDTKLFQQAGSAGNGVQYAVVSPTNSAALKEKMKNKLGNDELLTCSPTAYDAVKIIAQVMKKVGSDSTAIKNELYKTKYIGGVSADTITFDQNGDPSTANYVVKVVNNGKMEPVK